MVIKKILLSLFLIALIFFSGCSDTSVSIVDVPNPLNVSVNSSEEEPIYLYLVNNCTNETNVDVNLHDALGNPINSHGGAIDIHDAHIHSIPFNHLAFYKTGTNSTLNGSISAGSREIPVYNSTGFTVGDYVDIQNSTSHIHQWRKIVAITGNIITIDAGVNIDITNNSLILEGIANMNVDGSTTPAIFSVTPQNGEVLHLIRSLFSITSAAAADHTKFGGISSLTNGVILRINHNNSYYTVLTTWHSNADIIEDMYNVIYTDKAGGGNYGVQGRWTWEKDGYILKIDSDKGEVFEVVIQDDLTSLIDFQIKVKGHPEE